MRTHVRSLGWGWSIRAAAGVIGVGLAFSSTPLLRAQSSTTGRWTTLPFPMPINPVHSALMHNGKVLIVSGSGNVAAETNFRSAVLDVPGESVVVTQSMPWDMFCNGMVILADGRPFVNGGNLQYDPFHGHLKNAAFDPATGMFTDLQNMAHGRWYPTTTTLGDGRVMTFSGLNETGGTNTAVEIYTVGAGWSPDTPLVGRRRSTRACIWSRMDVCSIPVPERDLDSSILRRTPGQRSWRPRTSRAPEHMARLSCFR